MLALCWNLVYKADLKFAALLGLGVRISSGSLELIDKFKQYKTFVGVAKSYNITDNGVRKWCRLYKIPDTSKKMKEFLNQINI